MQVVRQKESAFEQFYTYLATVGVAQALTRTVTAPLERLKLVLQAQNVLLINERAKYKTASQFFSRVPKEQGFLALFRGNSANVFLIVPQSIAQFFLYDNVKRFYFTSEELAQPAGDLAFVGKNLGCALTCGFFSLLFTYPFDSIKTRISLEFARTKNEQVFKGVMQTIGATRQRQGALALYQGFLLTNLTQIPYFLALYAGVEALRANPISAGGQYVNDGAWASVIAHLVIYPLDTIRRRLQMNGYNRNPMYANSIDCFKQIVAREGAGALYNGVFVSAAKQSIAIVAHVYFLSQILGLRQRVWQN